MWLRRLCRLARRGAGRQAAAGTGDGPALQEALERLCALESVMSNLLSALVARGAVTPASLGDFSYGWALRCAPPPEAGPGADHTEPTPAQTSPNKETLH